MMPVENGLSVPDQSNGRMITITVFSNNRDEFE